MSELQTGGGILHWLQSGATRLVVKVGQARHRFSPWVLLVPITTTLWIITQVGHPWWKFSQRAYQEMISPWILGTGFVASATFWVFRGEFFHRWMILVTACLLIRAVQPEQFGPVGYVAAAFLLWNATANRGKMRHFSTNSLCVTLLGGALSCYTAVVTCVWGWWSFLPRHGIWESNLRQTLESLGHAMMVAAVMGTEILWRPCRLDESDAIDPATVEFPQVSQTDAKPGPKRRAA